MKLFLITAAVYFIGNNSIYSQTFITLPLGDTIESRYEDMYFPNESTGIIVNYSGRVNKTTDKGLSWFMLQDDLNPRLRSIGMFNSDTGIIGTLDSSNVLYMTTNGGTNWTMISAAITGTVPKGICGISIVSSETAYACGRYECPANVIKTTNAGMNWISLPLDTSLIRSLVDCHFWSADSGFVVGGYDPINRYFTGKSVILFTSNGGTSWVRVYQSARIYEWCWKIQFVNRQLGFTSIEKYGAPTFILKTTNGGQNWTEIALPSNITNLEGIGFLNEQTGWVGGWGVNYYMPSYRTTNGGANWHLAGWGINVNRFRFINDSVAYSLGKSVYKYSPNPIGIHQISSEVPAKFSLHQNYPNPFNPVTKIKFEIPENSFVTVKVYDALGKEIAELADDNLNAGIYSVSWDASAHPSGVYFYKIFSGAFSESRKMILIK
jgi:photosystem II stability/assembly factor-like uncharacterized protein